MTIFRKKEFTKLRNIQARIHYLSTRKDCYLLDYGSSRTVFSIENDKKVIKLGRLKKGKEQNRMEYKIFSASNNLSKRYFAKIFARSRDYSWIIVEKAKLIKSDKKFKEITGISLSHFVKEIKNDTKKYTKLYKELSKNKGQWFAGLVKLVRQYKLEPDDISKFDSWGISKKNRVMLIDYGLTSEIWDKYYNKSFWK